MAKEFLIQSGMRGKLELITPIAIRKSSTGNASLTIDGDEDTFYQTAGGYENVDSWLEYEFDKNYDFGKIRVLSQRYYPNQPKTTTVYISTTSYPNTPGSAKLGTIAFLTDIKEWGELVGYKNGKYVFLANYNPVAWDVIYEVEFYAYV